MSRLRILLKAEDTVGPLLLTGYKLASGGALNEFYKRNVTYLHCLLELSHLVGVSLKNLGSLPGRIVSQGRVSLNHSSLVNGGVPALKVLVHLILNGALIIHSKRVLSINHVFLAAFLSAKFISTHLGVQKI